MKIYIDNVTALDFGAIGNTDEGPALRGMSTIIGAEVFSAETDASGVVADFSGAKKFIKEQIDNRIEGFDHAVLIGNKSGAFSGNSENGLQHLVWASGDELFVSVPSYRARVVKFDPFDMKSVVDALETYVNRIADESGRPFRVKLRFTHSASLRVPDVGFCNSFSFSYIHGLPLSVSDGCKNVVHGHESSVVVVSSVPLPSSLNTILRNEVNTLFRAGSRSSVVIANNAYIKREEDATQIAYSVGDEEFNLATFGPVIGIDAEPTAENIAELLVRPVIQRVIETSTYGNIIKKVYVTEGCGKAAVLEF